MTRRRHAISLLGVREQAGFSCAHTGGSLSYNHKIRPRKIPPAVDALTSEAKDSLLGLEVLPVSKTPPFHLHMVIEALFDLGSRRSDHYEMTQQLIEHTIKFLDVMQDTQLGSLVANKLAAAIDHVIETHGRVTLDNAAWACLLEQCIGRCVRTRS
jgi:hypothetical protein